MTRALVIVLLPLAVASTVSAQALRGVVRDSTTGAGLAGVVVSRLDAGGAAVTRVLSTETGFTIAAPPGAIRLSFRKIGYIPLDTTIAQDSRIEIWLRRRVTQLAPVHATDEQRCDQRSDRREAIGLWEEARSALLAAAVLLETREVTTWTSRYRYTNGNSRGSQTVERREQRRVGRLLRAALPAAEFANGGYVRDTAGLRVYYSPDEMVFVDDSFAATHCFSLGGRPRDSTVAIRFEPDKRQKTNVDIEGMAVLRRNTLELLRIEFRYTRLPEHEARLQSRGFIEYSMTSLGVSIATHWQLRHPVPATMLAYSLRDSGSTWKFTGGFARNIPEEIGFMLESAEWSGHAPWRRVLPSVSGRVIGPGAERFTQLVVELTGTPYRMVPDDSGRFEFRDVLPGRYSLHVYDPSLTPFGVRRSGRVSIDVDSSGVTAGKSVRLELTRDAALRAACSEDVPHNLLQRRLGGDAILLGRVVDSSRTSRRADLRLTIESSNGRTESVEGTTDAGGSFRLCHLGVGQTVSIAASVSGKFAEMKGRVDAPLHQITLIAK